MQAKVAILGRPNVGKSTLFNRLVGRKLALVDDQPGVTRDRREGEAHLADLTFRLFDTAGLDAAPRGSLEDRMSAQSEAAIADADVCLFVIDARAGVTPVDREFAAKLRRHGKPVLVLANKAEGRAGESGALEAFSLGLGDPIAISAEHGDGMNELYEALEPYVKSAEESDETDEDEAEDKPLKLAIIGQPNAGKSTLVNALLGSERVLTGPEAGITRDAIAIDWTWRDKQVMLWDTAGIRRKSRVTGKVEKLAVADGLRAIRFADAVVVLIDASIDIERQDLTLADLAAQEGRAVVLALSKWDLVEDKPKRLKQVKDDIADILPEIRGVTIVPLSALHEKGLDRLMEAVLAAVEKWNSRISTGQLNRWLETMLERNPPPAPSGRRIKIRYATQVRSRPPTFSLFGNQLDHLPETYVRYLMNGLRETFELWGTPLRFNRRGSRNPFDKDKR
ncbi:ribosome biogenesis GTPase Der [Nordella sp. HKS 07]|uniref:ribosome biogenesis GTPase Der n=1 Tax=Nordella sp. HKS 07 TaxID=2712222 RepID=UPI0013E1DF90|nr:ribosome biogenesis GTPase Der [Nordella sp. HKS 07]QIG50628.1 ribosome biogenesis GTPase Der [Nordella sp. HKS 07]